MLVMLIPISTTVDLTNFQTRVLESPQPDRVSTAYGVALDDTFVYATHSWSPKGQPKVSTEKGTLRILSKGDLSEVGRITVGHFPRRVVVDRSRQRAYVTNYHQDSYSLSIVDLAAGIEQHEVKVGAAPIDVAVDTVRNRVFVTVPLAQAVFVIDPDPVLRGQYIAQKVTVGLGANGITVDERDGRVYVTRSHRIEGATWIGNLTVLHVTDAGYVVERDEAVTPDFSQPEFVTIDPLSERVYVGCLGGGSVNPQVARFRRPSDDPTAPHFPLRNGGYDARWGARGLGVDQFLNLLYVAEENVVEAFELAGGRLAGMAPVGTHMNGLVVDVASSQIYVADDASGSITRIVPRPVLTVEPRAPVGAVPAVAVNNDRWSVFVVSEDRSVRASHWRDSGWLQPDGTVPDWSNWQRLDGAAFPPGAPLVSLSRRPGHWDVAGVDDNGRLRAISGVDDAPGAWRELGGALQPGGHVAALSLNPNSVGVFSVAADGRVWSAGWNDADGTTGQLDHGGDFPPGAPIAVVSRKADHWDAFVVGTDGVVYTQWWSSNSGGFSGWEEIGGGPFAPGAHIAVLGRKSDHMDLFVVGTDGQVWTAFWTNEDGFSGWGSIGGNFAPGAPIAALSKFSDIIDLFITGPDQQVYTAWWMRDPSWSDWLPIGGLVSRPGAPLGVASVNVDPGIESMPNFVNVVWSAPNGAVETGFWNEMLGKRGWTMQQGVRRRIPTPRVHWSDAIGNRDDNLNGSINLSLWEDGSYASRGHIHNSGFDPHRFIAQTALALPNGDLAFSTYHPGRADGTGSGFNPKRDHDWMEIGSLSEIEGNFAPGHVANLAAASLLKSFVNKNIGLGGGIDSLLNEVLGGFLIGALSLNPTTGSLFAAVGLGSGILNLINADLGDVIPPGGLAGLVVAGGILFALGPNALIPAVVAGAVVGAQIEHRDVTPEEIVFAEEVFGKTLPWERIVITNLHSFGGNAFVFPHGEKILVNMGGRWNDTMTSTWVDENFTEPGQLFIHELTHAWQIVHESASFGGWVTCGGLPQIFGPKSEPTDLDSLDDFILFKVEQQAVAVGHWYAENYEAGPGNGLNHPDALNHRYYPFIRDYIRNPPGGTS
jgi:DNA-binding beta-propeller fold protein YncE